MNSNSSYESVLPIISEQDATGVVAELYQKIRTGFQIEFVPNFFKAQANRPDLLATTWNAVDNILIQEHFLPRTLKEMIFTAISKQNECDYCEAAHLAFCKHLGVSKESRVQLMENLDNLKPLRSRDIIKIALKMGSYPVNLEDFDYETLRSHGIGNSELQELVSMCSFVSYANVLADALKIPVDKEFEEILNA